MNKNASRPSIEARLLVREVRALIRSDYFYFSNRLYAEIVKRFAHYE